MSDTYLEFVKRTNQKEKHANQIDDLLKRFSNIEHVLDLACGDIQSCKRLLDLVKKHFPNITYNAVDINADFIEELKQINIKAWKCDIFNDILDDKGTQIPTMNNTVIFLGHVLYYADDEKLSRFACNLKRILGHNTWCIAIHNSPSAFTRIRTKYAENINPSPGVKFASALNILNIQSFESVEHLHFPMDELTDIEISKLIRFIIQRDFKNKQEMDDLLIDIKNNLVNDNLEIKSIFQVISL
jgi:hypothetical protein